MVAQKHEISSITVQYGNIGWWPAFNLARLTQELGTEESRKQLFRSLASKGWTQDGNGTVEGDWAKSTWTVSGEKVPLAGIAEQILAIRKEKLKNLEQAVQLSPAAAGELWVYKQLYCNEKGHLLPITVIAITGNCRNDLYFKACVDRRTKKEYFEPATGGAKEGTPKPLVTTIRVGIDDFSEETFRLFTQVGENLNKKVGFYEGSPADKLLAVKKLTSLGGIEARCRELVGVTDGVKMYGVCLLDSRFPRLQIIERASKSEEAFNASENQLAMADPDYVKRQWIDLRAVKHTKVQEFNARETVEKMEESNRFRQKGSKKAEPYTTLATEEEVAAYFANPTANETPKKRVLDQPTMKGFEGHPNPYTKMLAQAFGANKKELVNDAAIAAEACQFLKVLQDEGDIVNITTIIRTLAMYAKGEIRDAAERRVLSALKVKATEPESEPEPKKHQANKKPALAGK